MRRLLSTLCLGLLAATSAAFAGEAPTSRDVLLRANVTIDATGHITALEWVKAGEVEALIVPRIDAKVRGWEFTPGTLDGVPAETTTSLAVEVRAEALADGGLGLKFLGASTGPRVLSLEPPRYPGASLRKGSDAIVLVTYTVNADGTVAVQDIDVDTNGNAAQFSRAVREHTATWRFRPELVGGRVLPVSLESPVRFCVTPQRTRLRDGQGTLTDLVSSSSFCARHDAKAAQRAAENIEPASPRSAVTLKTDIRAQQI